MRRALRVLCLTAIFAAAAGAAASAQTAKTPKDPVTTKEPDSTYGPGGTKTTVEKTADDGTKVWERTVRDKDGVVREYDKWSKATDGVETYTNEDFDKSGKKIYENMDQFDSDGNQTYERDEYYKDGLIDRGYITEVDPATNELVSKHWDPKTQRYEKTPIIKLDLFKVLPERFEFKSNWSILGMVSFEGGGGGVRTFGLDASYSHAINPAIGLMADVEWTHGSLATTTFSKLQIMAGIDTVEHGQGKIFFRPHLLVGFAHLTSEVPAPFISGPPANGLAFAVGLDFGSRLNRKVDVQGRFDYNPTLLNGSMQHNFRLDGGVRLRF